MLVVVLTLSQGGRAEADIFGPPSLPSAPPASAPVLDRAGMLSVATVALLNDRLGQDNRSSKGQVAIAVVPNTSGLPIATFAEELFNAWRIGHASSNDGVLILIDAADRQVRVQTGSGLKTRISDATAEDIVDNQMLPELRAGSPDTAVTKAVAAVEHDLGLGSSSGSGLPKWAWGMIWVAVGGAVLAFVAWLSRRGPGTGGPDSHGRPYGYWGSGSAGTGVGGTDFGGGSSSGGGATGSW
jgi:uncharacterized protein